MAYNSRCEHLVPGLGWGRRRRDGVHTSLRAERGRRVGGGGGRIVAVVVDHGVLLRDGVVGFSSDGDGNCTEGWQGQYNPMKLHSQFINVN